MPFWEDNTGMSKMEDSGWKIPREVLGMHLAERCGQEEGLGIQSENLNSERLKYGITKQKSKLKMWICSKVDVS